MNQQKQLTDKDIIDLQDEKLDKLHGSLINVKHLANDLNQEIESHAPVIDDLDKAVDNATTNLISKNKQIKKTMKEDKKCCSTWVWYGIIALQIIIIVMIILSWFM